MTTTEFVAATYLRATGEVSTLSPTDSDYQKIIQLGNLQIDNWAKEAEWNSLYDPGLAIGSVSATDSFDLDDSIRIISQTPDDYVQILRTDGTTSNYQTVQANDLKRYAEGKFCARIGSTLRFNKAFTSSSRDFGGTIKVPSFLFAGHLSVDSDTDVPVDDPNWLVLITAADWVQSDITLAQNRPDLVSQANDLMDAMKRANGAQVKTVSLEPVARGIEW